MPRKLKSKRNTNKASKRSRKSKRSKRSPRKLSHRIIQQRHFKKIQNCGYGLYKSPTSGRCKRIIGCPPGKLLDTKSGKCKPYKFFRSKKMYI